MGTFQTILRRKKICKEKKNWIFFFNFFWGGFVPLDPACFWIEDSIGTGSRSTAFQQKKKCNKFFLNHLNFFFLPNFFFKLDGKKSCEHFFSHTFSIFFSILNFFFRLKMFWNVPKKNVTASEGLHILNCLNTEKAVHSCRNFCAICVSLTFNRYPYWEKFTINNTFNRVIEILVNWHISTGILTRIARYPRQNICLNVSIY